MRVFIFGDSITQGFLDKEGGWAARLIKDQQTAISENLDSEWVEIFNLGVSGDTTRGIAQRMANEVSARQLYAEDEFIIVATGTNDSIFRGSQYFSTTEQYRNDLKDVLEVARKITPKVLFVGMCGVDDAKSNPWKYSSSGKSMTTERIREFEKVLRDFCAENNVPIVKVLEYFDATMFADGIHPNSEGHKLIYEQVKIKLDEFLK